MAELTRIAVALVNGERVHIDDAGRAQHGVCPCCGSGVVARKGDVRAAHWAHLKGAACDPWYTQPKGPWHLYWQGFFPKNWLERIIIRNVDGTEVKHIADIETPAKLVIEVQYSPITDEDVKARESFYGKMIWIASMQRTATDANFYSNIRSSSLYRSKSGRRCYCFDERGIDAQKWLRSSKMVFLDGSGTLEHPESDGPLVCLIPKVDRAERIAVEVSRSEFVAAMTSDKGRDLLWSIKKDYDELRSVREDLRRQAEREAKKSLPRQKTELDRAGRFDLSRWYELS